MNKVKFKVYSRTESANGWEVRLNHVPSNISGAPSTMPANGGSIVLSNLTTEEIESYQIGQVFELSPVI